MKTWMTEYNLKKFRTRRQLLRILKDDRREAFDMSCETTPDFSPQNNQEKAK